MIGLPLLYRVWRQQQSVPARVLSFFRGDCPVCATDIEIPADYLVASCPACQAPLELPPDSLAVFSLWNR